MRATLLCLATAVRLHREEPDPNAEMRQEIYELKRTVSEQSSDLAKLARIIGTRQDQLEGKVRNVLGDVQSLRGRGQDATSLCQSLRTCGECAASPICGWCSVEQACVAGDRHGSLHGECQFYEFSSCSSLSCATYPTCEECVADPVCGFCATDGICAEGDEFGPSYGATCAASAGGASWLHMHGSGEVCPRGLLTGSTTSIEKQLVYQKSEPMVPSHAYPQVLPAAAAPAATGAAASASAATGAEAPAAIGSATAAAKAAAGGAAGVAGAAAAAGAAGAAGPTGLPATDSEPTVSPVVESVPESGGEPARSVIGENMSLVPANATVHANLTNSSAQFLITTRRVPAVPFGA